MAKTTANQKSSEARVAAFYQAKTDALDAAEAGDTAGEEAAEARAAEISGDITDAARLAEVKPAGTTAERIAEVLATVGEIPLKDAARLADKYTALGIVQIEKHSIGWSITPGDGPLFEKDGIRSALETINTENE